MAEMSLDLNGIRRRHLAVASWYTYLTKAELDRGILLAEVDRAPRCVRRLEDEMAALQDGRKPEEAPVERLTSPTVSDVGRDSPTGDEQAALDFGQPV